MSSGTIDLQLSADECAFLYEHYLKGILTYDEEQDLMVHAIEVASEVKRILGAPSEPPPPEDRNEDYYSLNLQPGHGTPMLKSEMSDVSYIAWIKASIEKAIEQKIERGEEL